MQKDNVKGKRVDLAGNVADNVDIALEDIRYIREILLGSKDFFISGWSGIAWGIALIVGVIFTNWVISHPPELGVSKTLWVAWIILFTLVSSVEAYYYYKGARDTGRSILSTISARIIAVDLVICVQGLTLTLLFFHLGIPGYIPGVWLLSTGGLIFVAGVFFPGGIWIFGGLTFVASIIAFIMPEMGLYCIGFAGAVSLFWGIVYLVVRRK